MTSLVDTLTLKEKETLRLIVRGHDAKSAARELQLSVHTINERLRHARRKLAVTSSREAARMLLETEKASEGQDPQNSVHTSLGDAPPPSTHDAVSTANQSRKPALTTGGIVIMSLLTVLGLALAGTIVFTPSEAADPSTHAAALAADAEREEAARRWLKLVDASDWEASYKAARRQFQEVNTVAGWRAASEQARVPLGAVVSREAATFQVVPSDEGYEVVRFNTRFANKANAIETVSLTRENGVLKVAGYYID